MDTRIGSLWTHGSVHGERSASERRVCGLVHLGFLSPGRALQGKPVGWVEERIGDGVGRVATHRRSGPAARAAGRSGGMRMCIGCAFMLVCSLQDVKHSIVRFAPPHAARPRVPSWHDGRMGRFSLAITFKEGAIGALFG